MKILIVDDNKDSRYLLESMLKGNDFTAVSAVNGAEALEKLQAQKFGLIISDILMPVMDGYQLCRECKKDEKLKKIPFIFYTATYTDPKDEEFALKLGGDCFIRKPIDPDRFIQIIREVLSDAIRQKKELKKPPLIKEQEVFKLYSERLVKKLEKKMLDLESSEKKYKTLIESLNNSVFIIKDGKILYVNAELTRKSGYTKKQLIGKPFLNFVAPEEQDKVKRYYFNRMSGKKVPDRYESKAIIKSGEILPVEVAVIPIKYKGKQAEQVILRDISAQKKAEQKIKNLNSLLKSVRDVNQLITKEIDLQKIVKGACNKLKQIRDYRNIEIALLDDAAGITKPAGSSGVYSSRKWEISLNGKGNAPKCIKDCFQRNETISIDNPKKYCKGCQYFEEDIQHENIIIPIFQQERVVGFLSAALLPEHQISSDEIDLLEDIAGDIGFAREKCQTEGKLWETEQEKALILSSVSEFIAYLDNELRIHWTNRAATESVGLSLDELVGRHCYEIWPQQSEPCIGCPVMKTIKRGKPQEQEMTTPDGKVWYIRGYPVRGKNGDVIGAVEITKDITVRKHREKEYKQLINGMNDTVFVIDFEEKFVEVNDSAIKNLGYTREELLTMGPVDIDPYLNADDIGKLIKGMKSDEKQVFETEHRTKEDKIIPVEISSSPITYKGKPAILSVARDINKRKQAEREISEQRKFHQLRADLWKIANKPVKTETELIDKILNHIGPAIDVSRISFLRLDPKKSAYILENQWHTKEAGPSKNQSIGYLKAKLLFGKKYAVLPRDAVPGIKQYITRKFNKDNIFTYIAMPYGRPGKPEGLFTISECRKPREWTQAEIDTLKEIVNIIDLKSDEIRAQREIYQSENRLKEAQALGKIGSWEFDVENNEIIWTDETYRLYERNPTLGPPTSDEEAKYYPPEQTRRLREYARTAIEDGKNVEYDLEAHLPSGRTIYFSATLRPIKDEKGKVIRLQGTVQDITKRKKAEGELKQKVEELELFHRLSVGREIQMIELKKKINELSKQLGLKPPYKLSFMKENKNT